MNLDQNKSSQTATVANTATPTQELHVNVSEPFDFAAYMANLTVPVSPARHSIVEGTVVLKDKSGFYVDIHSKTDAFVPLDEAGEIEVGQNVQFVVTSEADDLDGAVTMSRTRLIARLERDRVWQELKDAKEQGTVIDATVKDVAKARGGNVSGLIVTANGIDGFIPRSELAVFGRLDEQKDKQLRVKVIDADPEEGRRGTLILSQKRAAEAEQDMIIGSLTTGTVVPGVVTHLLDKGVGALVNIGGVTGLVHRTELGGATPKVGDEVQVKIVKIDATNRKLSLSMKQVEQQKLIETLAVGEIVTGRVARFVEYGVFVELGGVDGLLHLSEIPGKRGVKETYTEGQVIDVKIVAVDAARNRVALSRRDLTKKA